MCHAMPVCKQTAARSRIWSPLTERRKPLSRRNNRSTSFRHLYISLKTPTASVASTSAARRSYSPHQWQSAGFVCSRPSSLAKSMPSPAAQGTESFRQCSASGDLPATAWQPCRVHAISTNPSLDASIGTIRARVASSLTTTNARHKRTPLVRDFWGGQGLWFRCAGISLARCFADGLASIDGPACLPNRSMQEGKQCRLVESW